MELVAAHLHLLRWRSYSILLLSALLVMMIPLATYATQRQQLSTSPSSSSSSVSQQHKLEVQNHLKSLNKPTLKSIRSPDGDTIDCVHMSQQPAFNHPLLKNHKLQMRPNFHPDNNNDEKGSGLFGFSKMSSNKKQVDDGVSSSPKGSVEMAGEADDNKNTTTSANNYNEKVVQLWHLKGRCPKGTIPIRRTKKEDILRASTVQAFGKKKQRSVPRPKSAQPDLLTQSGHQHAIVYVEGDKYYGAKATMNVWEPQIQQPNEFSLSQIWILGGSFGQDLNSIEAGWQVSPDLYGDNRTRLFTYWTSDAYQATGCYNLLCSGFIQINNEIAMGASIYPLSAYQTSQYDITLLVWKDPKEGNWWVQFGNEYVLGYWPAMLFSYLSDSASMIEWGGEIVNSESDGQHTTTQMGSGRFPREGFGKAAYFKNIQIVDGSNNLRPPKGISIFTEQSDCYDVRTANSDADNWGNYFFYGGPGRNANCP